ncbi:MAG: prolyl-tRNA synthetase associated domain-containing protein [Tannerella sp.]|jgi:Ala-tRNA(Pro) deacylase|nr:prolyl-tRNA synthetase associated domain-containing protein [Tannerella sp.]
MNGSQKLFRILSERNIPFEYLEHPATPTIEIAGQYWTRSDTNYCKNLFFRNHKGNRHYLVILDCNRDMDIHAIEKQLHQGKLSFASEQRMMTFLGVSPGAVTPFGLINDEKHHIHVFLDKNLQKAERLSFHPCVNTASLIILKDDFIRFMDYTQNTYEWIELY